MDWRQHAACRDVDPELFFPVGEDGPALDQEAAAKTVCHRCPVMIRCLGWSVESYQEFGIWGGTTPEERRRLRRMLPPDASTPSGLVA